MKSGLAGLSCLLICTFAFLAFGAEVYVSPTGNDAAAGTAAAPLATLAAARDKADVLKANNTPVTVFLRGGTYYLSAPVVFGPANSGAATAPIVYTAYGSEKPVISGGIKVPSAAWAVSSGSIMVTTIAQNLKVDQLFLNGKRQVLARFPNFNAATVILDGYDANCLSRVGNWGNPGEGPGYIRGLHTNQWGGNSYKITGKNGTTLTQTWVGDNNRGSGLHATYRMVENIYEELDAAGEWFYRKSTGQLFFWPPAGTNLSTATIELASQDELLRFVGTSGTTAGSTKYIQFNGITFTHTFRTLFSKPYETILKSDWALARAGTVFMQNAENIRIANCLFDQVGGNGVFLSGYNRNNVIYNNVFIDAGASGVLMVGLTSSVRCPNSWSGTPTCTDRARGPLTNDYPAYIVVDNNMINHPGRFEKQSAGINLSMTSCDTVRHNTVHDCPRAGINFTDGCWGGSVIEFNWAYNTVLETSDHGPFNAWGRDRNERWSTDTTATTLDAQQTTIIRNNRFEVKGGFGIDMDDQASNYWQSSNLCMGGGLKLQWNRYNTYINNILVRNADVEITGVWAGSNHYMTRNIFTNGQTYWCNFFNGANIPNTIKANTKLIDSNCLATNAAVNTEAGGVSWATWRAAGLDVHSVQGDAMFTDTNKTTWATWANRTDGFKYDPKGDYSVRTGSPALGLNFKNFPMDSFGVMPAPGTAVQSPYMNGRFGRENVNCTVRYCAGILTVLQTGEYKVTITNASGRTVKAFGGKDSSRFVINKRKTGSGVYIASVRSAKGVVTQKFLVN
jgi:hypothetical protein